MVISFNNIPDTVRTPGVYLEVDNSRALKGLIQNPHKVLIIGQRITAGTVQPDILVAITRDNLADGFFGPGSMLARMCNVFKDNNPNTELFAIAQSDAGAAVKASGTIQFSIALSATGASMSGTEVYNLMIAGTEFKTTLISGWSVEDANSAVQAEINSASTAPVTASTNAASALNIVAVNAGTVGNDINIRENYFVGQSSPVAFGDSAVITAMAGGATDPDLGDIWPVIDNEQYHDIIQPYTDAANLIEIEDELKDRFLPLVDLQGHGFTAARKTVAAATTLGNSRNSQHNTIVAANDSPNCPIQWAAAWGAVAAFNLNNDPARPLHTLQLKGILPPPEDNRFTRAERDILLFDGIATFLVDSGGRVLIERSITTFQTNSFGGPDPSFLDIQTLFTLMEIRFQYKSRMLNRFIQPRFKLADDTFPVQPGSKVATPRTVKEETIALFNLLQEQGLIENIDDFVENLVVERNLSDPNRVDVLLPPDLINQFRILAGNVQFIL